ncbi:hypothetical protein Cgig2_019446 [Carnegiea gigantea]|uniref:Carbonic anhydrase n=1 Tax=Carnegiea gigantea TaxID=171969 RepID=A0A9Q1KRP8_9CARY|nr:hypothetical protein Cgig2_019446 [Carnegiea gigantea]
MASSLHSAPLASSSGTPSISGSSLKLGEQLTLLRFSANSAKMNPPLRLKASVTPPQLTTQVESSKEQKSEEILNGSNPFSDLKQRFLDFKKDKYLANIEHFQSLAQSQSPKSGPSETKAALEFSVNTLQVENILVIGHSCCGGIRALMSMEDEDDSRSFIRSWVIVGKNARLATKSVASNLSFDQQCRHCEKESINRSLMNLLSYPWIKERVAKGVLSIHGGYYDFTDCTFEKWTLNYQGVDHKVDGENSCSIKDREFWR